MGETVRRSLPPGIGIGCHFVDGLLRPTASSNVEAHRTLGQLRRNQGLPGKLGCLGPYCVHFDASPSGCCRSDSRRGYRFYRGFCVWDHSGSCLFNSRASPRLGGRIFRRPNHGATAGETDCKTGHSRKVPFFGGTSRCCRDIGPLRISWFSKGHPLILAGPQSHGLLDLYHRMRSRTCPRNHHAGFERFGFV